MSLSLIEGTIHFVHKYIKPVHDFLDGCGKKKGQEKR